MSFLMCPAFWSRTKPEDLTCCAWISHARKEFPGRNFEYLAREWPRELHKAYGVFVKRKDEAMLAALDRCTVTKVDDIEFARRKWKRQLNLQDISSAAAAATTAAAASAANGALFLMEFDQRVGKRKRHSSEDGYVAEMVVQPPASSPVVSPEPGEFYMMETLTLPSGKLVSCVKRTMRAALVALQDLCTLNGLARKDEIGPMARDLRNIRPALGSPLHTADERNTFLDQVVAFRHGLAHSNFEFLSDYVALAELVKVAAFLDQLGSANPDVKSFVFWIVAEIIMRSGQKPHSALRPSAPKSERVSSFADLPTVPGVDIAKVVGDLLDDVYIALNKFVARHRGEFPVVSTTSLEAIASGLVDVQRKQLQEHRGRPVEELPVHRHLTLRPGTSVAATMRWLKWNLSTFATWSVPGKDVSAFEALRVITSIIDAAKIIGHGVDDMCSLLIQVLCTYFQTIKIRTIGKERESLVFGTPPRKKDPRRTSSMSSGTDSDSRGRNSRDRNSSNRNSSNRDRSNRNYCGSGNRDSRDRDRCDHDCGDLNRLDRDSRDHAKLLCPRRGRDRDSSDRDSSDRDSSDRDSNDRDSRNRDSSDHDSSNSSDRKESDRGSSDCHRSDRGNNKRGSGSGGGCKHAISDRTSSICDGRDRTSGNHDSRDRDCGDLDSHDLDSGDHASNDSASTDSITAGRKKGAFKKRKSCR